MEKVVIKCICRFLAGFHFEEVPDAIEIVKQKAAEMKVDDSD